MSKADIADSGTPFILYGELYTTYGEIVYQINRKTEKIVDKKYYSKIGDVVVPTSGETAEEISTATCIMKDDVILAGDLNIFRGSKIDGRILSYLLNHKKKYEIASVAQGASIIHIKADDLKKIKINVPCKIEQEKIASFLTSIDNIISTQESNISILETYNRGLISKIFKQEIRFKDDNGNEFPDWEEKRLGDLFDIFVGGDIDKKHSSEHQTEKCCYPVFANALIDDGLYGYADYYKNTGDTITVTGRGDVGHAVARHCAYVPIVRLLVLVPRHKECVDFFAYQINVTKIFVESTGVPQLTSPQLSKVKLKCPYLEEQEKIANFLTSLDNVLLEEKNYLEYLKTIKKGLLQQMFV